MEQFKRWNNILGWIVFAISFLAFFLTIEPSVSLWDCGEFIATSFKLEVGHPPGAPLFMIMARFFSLFAPGVEYVAASINTLSALASAFTILFLFWTITHIARKIIFKEGEIDLFKMILVLGSGLVGSLAYTFSDTFWFSAVEAEVYGSSSLFTALVFWAILKWEDQADKPYANRWIILIAYLMGLSIGVHLLNLLAIPAIVFVYYFRKFEVNKKGILYASAISVFILGFIQYGIIPGIVKTASRFELLFVNSFGLPYNSGVLFYALVLIGLVIWGLLYSLKKKKAILNTAILAFLMILIGYSSFTMIVIRSKANPPMDENNPEDVFSMLSYLNREQYGDRPLLFGQYYNAPAIDSEKGSSTYIKKNGKYVESNIREKSIYDSRFETIFPRMYSPQPSHVSAYKEWGEVKGKPISVTKNDGSTEKRYKPTFGENLRFFFRYQLGHMYFRYFMWNFAGRQNDDQGHGGILKGNWISGIPFIDSIFLGNQEKLTPAMKNNPSRNEYYFLPLLLGLFGLIFLYKKNPKDFTVITLLFFFTGIAIVIYLNQYPYQPRERDYAYAGSFYAFTIWIGLGVLALFDWLKKYLQAKILVPLIVSLSLLGVPVLMASENWDDHDRSGRYFAHDMAENYLESCAPNAILFTFGDNDTFPLWYAQEVEGIRTDVRVVNMSLLSTDWYIQQMRHRAYKSAPVPFSLPQDKVIQGVRDQVLVFDRLKDYTDIRKIMDFVASDEPGTQYRINSELSIHYIPSKKLRIPVDKEKVLSNGTVAPELADQIVPNIDWTIPRNSVLKNELMMLDILATNNWERPVYFAISAATDSYIGLKDYFQLEGFAYRLVPVKTKNEDNTIGRVNTDVLYQNLVHNFKWGRMQEDDVWMDSHNRRQLDILNIRTNFARLGLELIRQDKMDEAIETFDRCCELMPNKKMPYDQFMISILKGYYLAGAFEKGNDLGRIMTQNALDDLYYYYSLDGKMLKVVDRERNVAIQIITYIIDLADSFNQADLKKELEGQLQTLAKVYNLQ